MNVTVENGSQPPKVRVAFSGMPPGCSQTLALRLIFIRHLVSAACQRQRSAGLCRTPSVRRWLHLARRPVVDHQGQIDVSISHVLRNMPASISRAGLKKADDILIKLGRLSGGLQKEKGKSPRGLGRPWDS
jgi:hypothetical protein